MKTKGMLTIAVTVLVLALVCPPVYGQDPETAKEPSGTASGDPEGWEFTVVPYIWMISLNGDATVQGNTLDVDVGFFDIFSGTDFAFGLQAHVEAWNKRKWGLWFDGTWVVLKVDDIGIPPQRFDLKTNIGYFEIGALYNFIEKPFTTEPDSATWSLQGLVGTRITTMKVDFDFNVGPSVDQGQTWADPILGGRAVFKFGSENRWNFTFRGDFGGFGVGSDFTWKLMGLFGYDFHIGSVPSTFVFGYGAMYQDFESGSGPDKFAWDVTQYGPLFGLALHF